ncbi:MAG: N-6 DNA methylase, partial [bacterium]|nr:N-6 DNA methylase [bacterium]
SYARDAKARIELAELPALSSIRSALEEALGLKFEGDKGTHFFKSTLIQTLFYGVFSAWVLWSKQNQRGKFDWRTAAWTLHVPAIKTLFEQIATPSQLGSLDLVEVLDWTATALNRVERSSFFETFEEGHAVQYFYEPFLQAFDPELRKELGVWFTPPEIVQYMVARIDTVLREELEIPDGLADKNVYVLDPCCGTGAYLVEVLKKINTTLKEKGEDALIAQDLKKAAMERVFGFEILPAPFVVSHLQLGLLLQNLGAPLSDRDNERAGVYLTNALTGWEPPKEPKTHLLFPELEEERDAAEEVKRDKPILVILGNPPYNAFAGVSTKEEGDLTRPYKDGLISDWGIRAGRIDDLYIRFFRIAERRIAEKTGKGIVSYISNHSWVSDPVFVVLRKHLLESFDTFWIENMHGNRKISEYAPDGRTSETIFAIPGFSVGIQQGVAISLWVKSGKKIEQKKVLYRDDLNAAKAVERRKQLLNSLDDTDLICHYSL